MLHQNAQLPLLLPGINLQTTPTGGYPIQDMQMIRFEGNRWQTISNVIQTQ